MSTINDELEESSVGTMMPVVSPDQTMSKATTESIDREFGALKMFSSGEDEPNVDDEFDEDANIDSYRAFKETSQKIEKLSSKLKKELKKKDYKNAKKTNEQIIEILDDLYDELKVLDGGVSSTILGFIIESIDVTLKEFLYGILTFGIGALVVDIKELISQVSQLRRNLKNDKEITPDTFNVYRNKLLAVTHDMKSDYQRVGRQIDLKLSKKNDDSKDDDKLESVDEDILHMNGLDSIIYEDSMIEERVDYFSDDEFFGEAAKIDDDIKETITKLNDKGYQTLYSCSGHPSARLKSDGKRDGIKDKKLYSTAKIVFADDYNFPSYPDGWEEKKLDAGNIGIYVKGPTFRIINGLPTDQFYDWKKKYMYHLKKWVDELPDKDDLGKEDTSDEITESMNELFQEMMIDLS